MAVLNPLTMMLILGTIQAVSKFISENPARYPALLRRALRAQFVFGGILALAFALLAPSVADLLGDESLTPALRIGSLVIFCYALYAALVGGINGLKRFHVQAGLDVTFSTLKVGLIVLAMSLGYGAGGAMAAFAATAALLLLLAFFLSRNDWTAPAPWQDDVSIQRLLAFEVWIILYALASNLLMNADLYLVKAMIADASAVGVYAACVQVARLPYVAVISVTFVLFPVISKALYSGDVAGARRGMYTACRYALLIVGPVALSLAALSADVLRLVFPAIYADGAAQLSALALAYVGLRLSFHFHHHPLKRRTAAPGHGLDGPKPARKRRRDLAGHIRFRAIGCGHRGGLRHEWRRLWGRLVAAFALRRRLSLGHTRALAAGRASHLRPVAALGAFRKARHPGQGPAFLLGVLGDFGRAARIYERGSLARTASVGLEGAPLNG